MTKKRFQSFEEFWPHYVRAHSKRTTRRVHFAATTAALGCAAVGLLTGRRWLLLVSPLIGYVPALASHWLIEKNGETTDDYPVWALRADLLMWKKMLDGTMDDEVAAVSVVDQTPQRQVRVETVPEPNMRTDGTLH